MGQLHQKTRPVRSILPNPLALLRLGAKVFLPKPYIREIYRCPESL